MDLGSFSGWNFCNFSISKEGGGLKLEKLFFAYTGESVEQGIIIVSRFVDLCQPF